MSPIIDIVRHGEARHNVEKNGSYLRDPSLTPNGVNQCRALCNNYRNFSQVAHIISSPMRRAIETTVIAFEPLILQGARITLIPELQETSARPSDIGSPKHSLAAEFGGCVDMGFLTEDWYKKDASSSFGSDPEKLALRAQKARLYIREVARSVPENAHIVVVTHSAFVKLLIQGNPKFGNAEMMSCRFVDLHGDDDDAVLTEFE
ncbi:histidine phosphatase superfamily [Poronia punctata]|nr:histidine phosphatase superfamily [Poronia punctata]